MLLPVAALHEDEVLLEVLEPFIGWHVHDTLLDDATDREILTVELVQADLLL